MISKFTMQWPTYDHEKCHVVIRHHRNQTDPHGKIRYVGQVWVDKFLLWETESLFTPHFYDESEVAEAVIGFCVYDLGGKNGEEPQKWGVQLSDDLSTIELDLNEGKHYEYDQVDENWWQE